MTQRGIAAAVAVVLAVVLTAAAPAGAGGDDVADGFVDGREHEVRVRSVLGEVPPEAGSMSKSARRRGRQAVATCDPIAARALGRKVPTTVRDGDDRDECVLLEQSGANAERLLLGNAHLAGSELGAVTLRRGRAGNERVLVKLSTRGQNFWTYTSAQVGDAPLAVTLDSTVLDLVAITDGNAAKPGGQSFVVGGKRGVSKARAEELRRLLGDAELEDVIELGRTAALTRAGRDLYAHANPAIREKADFVADCPLPDAENTFALGCFNALTNVISILRVDRADIAGVMPVTAAHEMLHAAYAQLDPQERRRIDRLIDRFLAATPQQAIEDELALYNRRERANEAHSLVGTEVRDLPRALDKYYNFFFRDRSAVVALYEGYESVFRGLEEHFTVLEYELADLEGRLNNLKAQADAAGNEADGLLNRINELRRQGRIDESNGLVDSQNAAADRANSLAARVNALVDEYNAKVNELNAAAASLGELYNAVTIVEPIPTER